MGIDLDELERRAKAATNGPWHRQDFHSDGPRHGVDCQFGDVICASYGHGIAENFDFIAAANPAVVLELVRRLREAQVDLDELRNRPPAAWRVKLPTWPDFGAWNDAGDEDEYAYWSIMKGAEFQYAIIVQGEGQQAKSGGD